MHPLLIGTLLSLLPAEQTVGLPPKAPSLVFVDLEYPRAALDANVIGRVIVRVETNDLGQVTQAEALAGPPSLVPAVLANVKQWTVPPDVGPIVFRFEYVRGTCNDDRRSLFRLEKPNLAVITACFKFGKEGGGQTRALDEEPDFVTLGQRPRYPPLAASARVTDVVVLELAVSGDGAVESIPLTQRSLFTSVAVAHTRRWKVAPGHPGRFYLVYEFALDNHACDDETTTAFWRVASGYWRLSACSP